MPEIGFDRLIVVYDNVTFDPEGDEGSLHVATVGVRDDLALVERDDRAASDTGIVLLSEPEDVVLGATVRVRLDAPKPTLGLLARNLDALLAWPGATIAEPVDFYVIDGRYHRSTVPPPADLEAYRRVLALVGLLGQAAVFLDPIRREMMFMKDGRMPMPVTYDAADVAATPAEAAAGLLATFGDDTHREQKLAILAEVVVGVAAGQPRQGRLGHVLRRLDEVLAGVRDGYRLFASEFSYDKVRSDVEDARLDYLSKIHKTFVDVQGQMLGIPVATVVVASQLKPAKDCGGEFWIDVAVLAGAWVFVLLLWLALENQRLTLGAIEAEVSRQRSKILSDYAAIDDRFTAVFDGLRRRIRWQRAVLASIALVGLLGGALTTVGFVGLVRVDPRACVDPPAAAILRDGSDRLSVRL
ncbi:hypothetical protein [Lichenibacterium ramalinae]|uniref:Uncharacterized protein n=1 Tax=Lichenibacterium ramalinae TaxID=2316527 RepID=A0A4Q2RB97_9HYPH|nr:hypothetical protein [Lichenibacterium ramalinae]RYB04450.1 hypothetical protein D3272_13520 [Lichenibacterium ramalinae]